jgi:hypothetical protein
LADLGGKSVDLGGETGEHSTLLKLGGAKCGHQLDVRPRHDERLVRIAVHVSKLLVQFGIGDLERFLPCEYFIEFGHA